MEHATLVAIGIIGRGGRYLIRRRPPLPGSPMPGFWEFPGGKCEPGEAPEAAVARECREELGFAVVPRRLRRVARHRYAHGLIELYYFDCESIDPNAQPSRQSGFVWVLGGELPLYRFPDANSPIVAELAREANQASH